MFNPEGDDQYGQQEDYGQENTNFAKIELV
jgi:hypothetical protein